MIKPKHTPGPWRVKRSTSFNEIGELVDYYWVGVGPIGDETPVTAWRTSTPRENEANARLIAAAPELLDLLKQASRHVGGIDDLNHAIEDLIARIEGEEP